MAPVNCLASYVNFPMVSCFYKQIQTTPTILWLIINLITKTAGGLFNRGQIWPIKSIDWCKRTISFTFIDNEIRSRLPHCHHSPSGIFMDVCRYTDKCLNIAPHGSYDHTPNVDLMSCKFPQRKTIFG